MTVKLLHHTPLWVCSTAIRKCWASEDKSDSYYSWNNVPLIECDMQTADKEAIHCGEKDKALIHRIGNQNKHSSTLEHLVYNYDINGISRACLQELSRHRMASYSVKSTRYTLKELKDEKTIQQNDNGIAPLNTDNLKIGIKYLVMTQDISVDTQSMTSLANLQTLVRCGISNDISKFALPEAYKTSLVMTINARSLQNFLALRTSKHALWEIRDLANEMYNQLPEDHKYLFTDFISKE